MKLAIVSLFVGLVGFVNTSHFDYAKPKKEVNAPASKSVHIDKPLSQLGAYEGTSLYDNDSISTLSMSTCSESNHANHLDASKSSCFRSAWRQDNFTTLKINFQDSATVPPGGWLKDFGQAFGPRSSAHQGSGYVYGWKRRSDNTILDLSKNGRKKTAPADTLLSTVMHMQANHITATFNGTKIEGYWEAEVPNGNYEVTVSVGDGTSADSRHAINIEGIPAITDFAQTAPGMFKSATVVVSVADGLLTVDPGSGTNTKINYIIIEPTTKTPFQVASFNVSADTYIRDSIWANDNYGSDTAMLVKLRASGTGFNRISFLKFNLGSVPTTELSSAKLRIYGYNKESSASMNLKLHGLSNDSWLENELTWNNSQSLDATMPISAFVVNNQLRYYELDVTDFIREQIQGDKIASFKITGDSSVNQNLLAEFFAREHTNNPPQLVVVSITSGTTGGGTDSGSSNANAWLKNGNSGTAPGTNFLGTTDNVGLSIKTNNQVRLLISNAGSIGMGTVNPDVNYLLSVNGKIKAKGLRVQTTGWADHVFSRNYKLRTLPSLEQYIRKYNHLPEVPSATEVKKHGIDLAEIQAKLLQKVEELTLYIIDQDKKIKEQERRIKELEIRFR